MTLEQTLLTWVHLISAALWVGGSVFLGAILAPVLKRMDMPIEKRISMMILVGRRFNWVAIPALVILIITGIYSSSAFFSRPELLFASTFGNWLAIKSILVVTLIVIFIVHVWIIRKSVAMKINSGKMNSGQLASLRKKIIILGEAMVIISIAILFFAALLDSGI